jgi:hypothetical protein
MRFQQKMKRTPLWSLSDPFGKKKAKRQMANQARRDREHAAFLKNLSSVFGAKFEANLKRRKSFFQGLGAAFEADKKAARKERIDELGTSAANRRQVEETLLSSRGNKVGRRKLPMSVRIKGGY